jgi:hypothetical protein
VTPRITRLVVGQVVYPRFGWGRCDTCGKYRLLFYVTPNTPGRTLCAACLKGGHATA